jgi:hypothetical protein
MNRLIPLLTPLFFGWTISLITKFHVENMHEQVRPTVYTAGLGSMTLAHIFPCLSDCYMRRGGGRIYSG